MFDKNIDPQIGFPQMSRRIILVIAPSFPHWEQIYPDYWTSQMPSPVRVFTPNQLLKWVLIYPLPSEYIRHINLYLVKITGFSLENVLFLAPAF